MMRTDTRMVGTGARLAALAGLALAFTSFSTPLAGREDPYSLCPNAPFSGCEPVALASLPEASIAADLDRDLKELDTDRSSFAQTGKASWYGPGFHGRKTASGARFNQHALTAAHRTLPMGTAVKVTNLDTGRTVLVQINDRGPYIDGRIIDLSKRAAAALGMEEAGVAPVRIEALDNDEQPVARRNRDRDVEVAEQPDQR